MSAKPLIVDERQKDTKSRAFADEMGISRHERLTFAMGKSNISSDDPEVILIRLAGKMRGKSRGSFATATIRDVTYRVDVDEDGELIASARQRKDGNWYGWAEVMVSP